MSLIAAATLLRVSSNAQTQAVRGINSADAAP